MVHYIFILIMDNPFISESLANLPVPPPVPLVAGSGEGHAGWPDLGHGGAHPPDPRVSPGGEGER